MPAVADDALSEDAREALDEFEAATEAIERALEPFLDADRKALTKELRPLERAEVHCEAARAIVALFGMYLKTLGVDPEKHATAKEMKRVEAYRKKIEETRARLGDGARGASAGGRKASVDVETAAKAIKDGVGSPGDLLKASLAAAGGDKGDGGEDGKEDGGKKRAASANKGKGSKKAKKK
uniref:Nuclear nucleic acid-binding protein C1D n=1 Tax=Ostreococcus sp. 'lucimarinus' TaxID=242159 RepID=A0A7R9T3M9_9CHLO|mmetsp:Transcript_4619/g.17642  ORF Transcript_4619/g.17642 Transcript_4619/m.17642 type:complete len:182 (+) Transcript_4619:395-940(+)